MIEQTMRCANIAVPAIVAQKVRSGAEEASVEARVWKMKAGNVTRCTTFCAACIRLYSQNIVHIKLISVSSTA